jgi:hypothetical protein
VRSPQIAALNNREQEDTDKALLRVANDMRKNAESMTQQERGLALYNVFRGRLYAQD